MNLTSKALVCASMLFLACNSGSKQTESTSVDTVHTVTPEPEHKPQADSASIGPDVALSPDTPWDSLALSPGAFDHVYEKNMMEGYVPHGVQITGAQQMLSDQLVASFTAKELYMEVLYRMGEFSADTIPRDLQSYITRGILLDFLSKRSHFAQLLSQTDDPTAVYSYGRKGNFFARRVVIGEDDRVEVEYDWRDLLKLNPGAPDMDDAKCVAAIVHRNYIDPLPGGRYKWKNWKCLREKRDHCTPTFIEQAAVAEGTAFVIDSFKLLTAGHCIPERRYQDYFFVFDYLHGDITRKDGEIPAGSIYKADTAYFHPNLDFCQVKLAKHASPARFRKLENRFVTTGLFHVIGCPDGIPLKSARNAKVLSATEPAFFMISSDTFDGNSGGPVFNTQTHNIEGILLAGNRDYTEVLHPRTRRFCFANVRCPENGCETRERGEKVMRVSQFINLIQ
ncbi:serine protease [Chitinophaga horti]|uniref:Serine protease n=1 Tax=Chitinophaga horti TaxID=2920382 RepID=A0ABY6J6T0_9BACT|nr:serine protease [Chitinophaga horti]UYQ95376.1 serine protease [Chitinophaga horti]